MGEIVFVGLWHLRTFFGTYEQFISVLWNVFLWNSAQGWVLFMPMFHRITYVVYSNTIVS